MCRKWRTKRACIGEGKPVEQDTERKTSRRRRSTGVDLRACKNGEISGLISICDFERKRADDGCPNVGLFAVRTLNDMRQRNVRTGDLGEKER